MINKYITFKCLVLLILACLANLQTYANENKIVLLPSDNVELSTDGFKVEGGGNFGYTKQGSWAHFAMDIKQSGYYVMNYSCGTAMSGNNLGVALHINGVAVDTTQVLNKGGWGAYNWFGSDTFYVEAGDSIIFKIEGITDQDYAWNMNKLELVRWKQPILTGLVPKQNVEISTDGFKVEGGGNFGYTQNGSWARFEVDFPESGTYYVNHHASTGMGSKNIFIKQSVNGAVVDSIHIVNNGGWGGYNWYGSKPFKIEKADKVMLTIEGVTDEAYAWNWDSCTVFRHTPIDAVVDLPKRMEILESFSDTITFGIWPKNGSLISTSYTVGDESIALVNNMGVVKGLKPGVTMLYTSISDGITSFEDSIKLSITTYLTFVDSIKVLPNEYHVEGGGTDFTDSLTVAFYPANTTDQRCIWKSDDPVVVSVKDGRLLAQKEGTAKLTVTTLEGNKKSYCTVHVSPRKVRSIAIVQDSLLLDLDGGILDYSKRISISVLPVTAVDRSYTIVSSNPKVATVDAINSRVTGLANGTAMLVVSSNDGNLTDTCYVEVIQSLNLKGATSGIVSLKIYPNPVPHGTSCMISVPETNEAVTVSVFDMAGRLVLNRILKNSAETSLYINDKFDTGIYLIKARVNHQVYVNKFTVK